MSHRRSLKCMILVFILAASMTGLQGCAAVALLANPVITAAIIATVPAIITVWSNTKTNTDRLNIEKLQAETARINAVTGATEKLNQQVVAQRQLELDLIKQQQAATSPEVKEQLTQLQERVANDQRVIAQSLNTANQEATNLARDQAPLSTRSGPSPETASTGPVLAPTAPPPAIPSSATAAAAASYPAAPTGAQQAPSILTPMPPPTPSSDTAPTVFGQPATIGASGS